MSTKECDAISGGGTAENQLNSVNRVNKVEGGGEETGSYFSDGLRKIDIVLAYEGKVSVWKVTNMWWVNDMYKRLSTEIVIGRWIMVLAPYWYLSLSIQ